MEGLASFSHLEVLGFQWQAAHSKQIALRRYRILEMLSTADVDSFSWPLSWGVSLGGESQIESPSRLQNHAAGKAGFSYDFSSQKIRWSNFLEAGAKQNENGEFQFTPGVESRLWVLWLPTLRSLLKFEALQFPSEIEQTMSFDQALDLNSQLEVRIGWRARSMGQSQVIEKTLMFQQNF